MSSREEAVIERGDPVTTAEDLVAALTAQFIANADAGEDTANDQLIEELAAWRRRCSAERSEDSGNEAALPYRLPGAHNLPAPAEVTAQEPGQPSLELLRRVREGLIHLPPTEFPTLDLDELEEAPLRRAVQLGAVERPEFPGILAAQLPGIVHARRERGEDRNVHEFIDTTTGSAVHYVLSTTPCGHVKASVAESGAAGLFDRIVAVCTEWERAGRLDSAPWLRDAADE